MRISDWSSDVCSSDLTALAIVVKRRDLTWLRFLLGKDADPSIADRQGMTPLMHAAMIGFADGADVLLDHGPPLDQANRRGEPALILAVQARNSPNSEARRVGHGGDSTGRARGPPQP